MYACGRSRRLIPAALNLTAAAKAIPAKVRSGFASGIAENKEIERFTDSTKRETL
jgi:hypothetical protein